MGKACAVVHRPSESGTEILAFRHPQAGYQLVKGTIELDERPIDAAIRELREESGVTGLALPSFLGRAVIGEPPLPWHLFAFDGRALPDRWTHAAADDGGHVFAFFWHPLSAEPGASWHPMFRQALRFVQESMFAFPT